MKIEFSDLEIFKKFGDQIVTKYFCCKNLNVSGICLKKIWSIIWHAEHYTSSLHSLNRVKWTSVMKEKKVTQRLLWFIYFLLD